MHGGETKERSPQERVECMEGGTRGTWEGGETWRSKLASCGSWGRVCKLTP